MEYRFTLSLISPVRKHSSDGAGFTVVEFAILISALAILAVVAFPRIMDLEALRIDMAARKIQSDIRYTQSLAVAIQKRTGLNFRTAQNDYSVYIEDGTWILATDPLTKREFTVTLNSGDFENVEIEQAYFNGYSALVFDRWGNPFGYEISTGDAFELNNPAGVRLTGAKEIRVERGTGRVYIQ